MSELARRANAVLRGSESARIRSAKGVAGRLRKAAMPERIMTTKMRRKKSPDEIPDDGSNEDIRYFIIDEDGSRKSALLKIIAGLSRFTDTVTRIPEVPPEITKMISVTLSQLSGRIVKTFPEDFPELRKP